MHGFTIVRTSRRLIATTLVALTIAVAGGEAAQAMSPPQTSANGVVQLLATNYDGSIDRFWRNQFTAWGYRYPGQNVYYYGGTYGSYQTGCGYTGNHLNNGFYCQRDGGIYLHYAYMQGLLNQYGDFGTGGFLAHEWGHMIGHRLGYSMSGFRSEYFADCLAGMYTRYGYIRGRLTGADYWEFYNWLRAQGTSTSHGTGSERAAWFDYGYKQYNINSCARVYN